MAGHTIILTITMHYEIQNLQFTHRHSRFAIALQITGIVVLCGLILLFIVALYYAKTLPTFQDIANAPMANNNSTRFYDRTGTILLYQIGVQHTTASFADFPKP